MKNTYALLSYIVIFTCFLSRHLPAREIIVTTVNELQNAIGDLASHDTILIANGTYCITATLTINNKQEKISDVLIKGQSGNRDSVMLWCPGMGVQSSSAPHVFNIYNIENLTIADLTAGKTYWHPVTISGQSGAESISLKNLHLVDAGEQFIKVNNREDPKCDNGIVDGCLLEYTDYAFWAGDHYYTQGFDKIGGGDNWIVRNCIIKNIRPHPEHVDHADGCGAAITYWQGGTNNIVEKNLLVNCRMGIQFGISDNTGVSGGIIRNNIIYRGADEVGGDNGIMINDSPDCKVYNNTVILNATFDPSGDGKGKAMEYRWDGSINLQMKNNLCDGLIWERTAGLSPEIAGNILDAPLSFFKDPSAIDLHLKATADEAVDKGISLPEVIDDIDGDKRPVNNHYDIGADEYTEIVAIKNNLPEEWVRCTPIHCSYDRHSIFSLYLSRKNRITVALYTPTGKKVLEHSRLSGPGSHTLAVNTITVSCGIYYCIVSTNTGYRTSYTIILTR